MNTFSLKKPIIGISASLLTIDTGCFKGRERAFVGQDYIQAILQAGGIPIILPIISEDGAVVQQMELIDGLLLSGGYDVHPLLYGEEPDKLLQEIYPARDSYEIELVKLAHQMNKPILGICRGLQLLNVAFGGTLYQDLSYHSFPTLQHSQKASVEASCHSVAILDGTKLKSILGLSTLLTNSFHHQAVKQIAPGFQINARARDGIVEGIEKMDRAFVMGVQWHPEFLFEKCTDTFKLFQTFVAASRGEL